MGIDNAHQILDPIKRALLEHTPLPAFIVSGTGVIANSALIELVGLATARLESEGLRAVLTPAMCQRYEAFLLDWRAAPLRNTLDLELRHSSGTAIPARLRHRSIDAASSFALIDDLRESERIRDELASTNAFLESILENIPNMIFIKDAEELRFVRFNRAGEELLGWPRVEMIGKNDRDFFPPEQAEFFLTKDREVLSHGGRVVSAEEPIDTRFKGRRFLATKKLAISDSRGRRYLLGISEDITEHRASDERLREAHEILEARVLSRTAELERSNDALHRQMEERQKLQSQVIHAQKMETIGNLAGGISHDFNNVLTGILGSLYLAKQAVTRGSHLEELLAQCESAAQQAVQLTQRLLSLGRKREPAMGVLNPATIVREAVKLLEHSLPRTIEVEFTLAPDLPQAIRGDAGQLTQALLNLGINARDAMPAGGLLHFDARPWSIPAADHAPKERPGEWVRLSVRDTGMGMTETIVAQIFAPFFTTKAIGAGTGLGLTMVLACIEEHGGWITVVSAPGRGTTFELNVPLIPVHEDSRPSEPAALAPMGHETILLVDDTDAVQVLTQEVLELHGYEVLVARHGEEALARLEERGSSIDLVLSDLVMPRLGGRELLRALRARGTATPVVLMSGAGASLEVDEVLAEGFAGLLRKPFDAQALAVCVREALDRAPAKGPKKPLRA